MPTTNNAINLSAAGVTYYNGTGTFSGITGATTGTILQNNTGSAPSYSTATYPSTTTINQLLYSSAANTITGLPVGTTGQVLTTNASGVPTWATIASGVSSVTGTANQISASPTTGAVVLSLIGPYTPATYTAHGVLVGESTSSIVAVGPGAAGQVLQSGGSSADPAYSTATYPSTTTINQLLYSSAANTITGLATVNSASLVTSSSGVPTWVGPLTNGQLIIGSSSATPVAATLTAGTGIAITTGAGSITVAGTGGGLTWTDVTTSTQTMAVNNGYTSDDGATLVTFTLPTTAAYGTVMAVVGKGAGLWTITLNSGQTINYGTSTASTSLSSTKQYDVVYLLTTTANTAFTVVDSIGNLTVV